MSFEDTVKNVHKLNIQLHENTSQFFHSRPMVASRAHLVLPDRKVLEFEVEYDIKDLFTIGALTESSILMTGGTDLGKTALAKLVMNSLFGEEGENWHRIDVATDFGKDTYTDVDFEAIKEGKKMSEGMYQLQNHFKLPGLILDEINRGHPKMVNILLHVFDQDVSLPDGSRAKIGFPIGDSTYQFQIANINEGTEYAGTFEVDKALRRRTVIEIPMDSFMPTPYDRLQVKRNGRDMRFDNKTNHLEEIIRIYESLSQNLQLHPGAEIFLNFLEAFDYCKNSLTKEKGSVASVNGSVSHVCTQAAKLDGNEVPGAEMGCHLLKDFGKYNICPYIRGITPGVSQSLTSVAKGFAVLRATKFVEMMANLVDGITEVPLSFRFNGDLPQLEDWLQQYTESSLNGHELAKAAAEKYITKLEVEKADIEAAIGFVGYSKIGISQLWVKKYFQGNRFYAIQYFTDLASRKFEEGFAKMQMEGITQDGDFQDSEPLKYYCERKNPWLWRALSAYNEPRENKGIKHIEEMYN